MKPAHSVVFILLYIFSLAACSEGGSDPEATAAEKARSQSTITSKATYTVPPQDTKTLIPEMVATRDVNGGIIIEGAALLPPGTKLRIERYARSGEVEAQSDAFVDASGRFSSEPFSDKGKAPKAGQHRISVTSYINRAWQTESTINIIGEGGANLPSGALQPNDPEFPRASGHLHEDRELEFPPMSEDVIAIDRVKSAKMYVQGKGQAVDTVGEIVAIFAKSPGFKPLGWSAEKSGAKWIVTLDTEEATGRRKAQWEFDPVSGKISYLDPLAKILSWVPAD